MNQNLDMGTFLTGVATDTKASTKQISARKGSQGELYKDGSQPSMRTPSPTAGNMMSFNFFVTHVPIDQLVTHAHS